MELKADKGGDKQAEAVDNPFNITNKTIVIDDGPIIRTEVAQVEEAVNDASGGDHTADESSKVVEDPVEEPVEEFMAHNEGKSDKSVGRDTQSPSDSESKDEFPSIFKKNFTPVKCSSFRPISRNFEAPIFMKKPFGTVPINPSSNKSSTPSCPTKLPRGVCPTPKLLQQFNNPENKVEILVVTYNTCLLDVNIHQAYSELVMLESVINANTILQTMGCIIDMAKMIFGDLQDELTILLDLEKFDPEHEDELSDENVNPHSTLMQLRPDLDNKETRMMRLIP
ncbi:hypothetical protein PRK78_002131 [Emydomyces testavorans]|uniref:Uncharacterized protein n=1 Tax=Emydomyces testavorans TaxID=2070801 RepID=A0AAF0IHB6_9EURO|nr:hypothetical protein PRK78_002131 [Emydomyces testavorans]